jgi:hypothetical protein
MGESLLAILSQPETQVHFTIIKAFLKLQDVPLVVVVFPYQVLRNIILVSTPKLAAALYHLLVTISVKSPKYLTRGTRLLMVSIIQLGNFHSVWVDTRHLIDTFEHSLLHLLFGII